jgi:glyoxylase I family protein
MFKHIHHIAIICSNYEEAKYFYTKILKLKIVQEIYRSDKQSYKLNLQLDSKVQIELFSFPNPPPRPSLPEACGLRHLAFTTDNLVHTIAYLLQHNIRCEPIRIDQATNKKFTFFKDPDGLPLELYEK